MTGRRGETGAVLLVVLVALALLAALAGVAVRLDQSGLRSLAGERAAFSRQVVLQSALALVGLRLGEKSDIIPDGTPFVLTLPEGRIEVRVQAAEGLVNPAHVRLPILHELLLTLGASPEQALRLTRAVGAARANGVMQGPWDVAPLFVADGALWQGLVPYLTFLGDWTTVDPSAAPPVVRFVLPKAAEAAVDITQIAGRRGFYEIDLRALNADETAQGPFTRYSVLRDKGGRVHLFGVTWPERWPDDTLQAAEGAQG